MATIGLDKLYYAKITENDNGDETYGTPTQLAKAMTAELSVELAEATLYADDGAAEVVKEFQSGTLTLGIDDIGVQVAQDLTGAKSTTTRYSFPHPRTAANRSPSASGRRSPTANTAISGFTRSSSASPRRTSPPRARALSSPHPPSRAPFCAATSWTVRASTRGKPRFPRTAPGWPHPLSAAGTRRSMNRYSPLEGRLDAVEHDRSAKIEIGGQAFELILTTRATKEIAARYGGLENLGQKLMRSENFEMALDELVWLITLLANQSVLIHNLRTPEDKQELLTQETVELLTSPLELAEYKTAIMEAMFKGTKRNVESENDSKNAQVG